MSSPSVELSPAVYWDCTEPKRAQRAYVSFCELAAAALDYAEGLSLIRRDERRQGAARLNWAGTAFYYSLVHSARFLVFTAVGDFPTQHNLLPKAFRSSGPTGVETNWLKSFADSANGRYVAKVTLNELVNYWSGGADDHTLKQIRAQLEWFERALNNAKALRNENNYEALLIAHEYRHEYLDNSFKKLAKTMAAVSKRALATCVSFYARVLRSGLPIESCSSPVGDGDCSSEQTRARERLLEGAFISQCVRNRIVEPARNWYGTDLFAVADAVRDLMKPLAELRPGHEPDATRIEELVSTNLFAPKVGLMDSFIQKITDLHRLLNHSDQLDWEAASDS